MINVTTGLIKKILHKKVDITYILIEIGDSEFPAINFDKITGIPKEGDIVVVNTTAVDLGLGTGGNHFVLGILFSHQKHTYEQGHIIKLRYTPYQFPVLSIEEQKEKYYDKIANFKNLREIPVVIGMLLSQVAICACVLKKITDDNINITYVMTDKSSLPMGISDLIYQLKSKKIIDNTITCGQAWGGDYEAVNIYNALIFAQNVLNSDVIIVSQGLGSVGTNTKYGYSGIEQGEIINTVNILGGIAIAILRVSFADKRERHYGVSHHSLTALSEIALTPAIIAIPQLNDTEKEEKIWKQVQDFGIDKKHITKKVNADITFSALKEKDIDIKTMGRGIEEDVEFFLCAGASAILASEIVKFRGENL